LCPESSWYNQEMRPVIAVLSGFLALAPFSAGAESPNAAPGYGTVMFLEAIAPGAGLMAMGEKREGAIAMSVALPMIVAGQGLIWTYYLGLQGGIVAAGSGDYVFDTRYRVPEWDWVLGLGFLLDTGGRAVAAYSAYAAHREWMEARGRASFAGSLETPLSLVLAPFSPAAISLDVLPFVIVLDAAVLPQDALERAGDFFASGTQPFWGIDMAPGAALAAKVLSSAVLSLAGSLGRELLLRGLVLERDGMAVSIFASGASPLLSLAVPGRDPGEAVLDSLSGAALGWYAAALANSDSGRLRKPVAFRFWLDFGRSVLGYLMDPTGRSGPELGVSVLFP
jgi:hypothetical protein